VSRISSAFRCFFSILFSGALPEDIAAAFGFAKLKPAAAPPPPAKLKVTDGALQLLRALQSDSRLVDFLMEDIAAFPDDQIGAAVRNLHADCRASLMRVVALSPVIDDVEGTFQKLDATKAPDAQKIKLLGNIPPSGKVAGGTLRHRGWRVNSIDLPVAPSNADLAIIAPAELEVE
jgi:hypothetical protein